MKVLSKDLVDSIKKYLSFFISSNQNCLYRREVYQQRWKKKKKKDGRPFSDILQVTYFLKLGGLLLTVDIQNAFDSVNQLFLIIALKKLGFGEIFIKWIQTLLRNQKSCIINDGATRKYFKLEKGTRQGDPISAYLCILVLEIAFL